MLIERLPDYGLDTVPGRAYAPLVRRLTRDAKVYSYDFQRELTSHPLLASEVFTTGMEFVSERLGDPILSQLGVTFLEMLHDKRVGYAFGINVFDAFASTGTVGEIPAELNPDYPQVARYRRNDGSSMTKILLTEKYLDVFATRPMSALAITVEFASQARDSAYGLTEGIVERSDAAVSQLLSHSLKDGVQSDLIPNYYCLEQYPMGIASLPDGVWY